jgi:outer membrane receptor for ferrienterochelin and colicin
MQREKIRKGLTLFFLLFFFQAFTQENHLLKGKVNDATDPHLTGLPGAIIKVKSSGATAVSGTDGTFEIQVSAAGDTLFTFLTSFKNDTTVIHPGDTAVMIFLTNAVNLKEVEIKHKTTGSEISMLNTMKLETLNERSLMKAACCNLSESFETNPSVDVNFADAVSGAKQIQLLGLGGQYAQITKENMPFMRGLANSYGLTFIPGTWIKSIQLGKGAGSVVNGYESFTGQINTELQPPENTDKVHFNAYGNQNGRNEYNLNLSRKLTSKFSTDLLSHVSFNPLAEDHNKDGFIDIPTGRQYNFANKYALYTSKGFEWQFGGSFLNDERIGGQTNRHIHPTDTLPLYKISITNQKWDAFSKTGYVFKRPATSMGLQLNYLNHDLKTDYSTSKYTASQQSAYANFIFESYIGTTNHKYKIGSSYLNDVFNESFKTLAFKRNETSAGVFGEYVFSLEHKFNVVAGSRLDYNNYYGWMYTPRLHLRFAFNDEKSVLRASGGKAWRTANVLAENLNYMASSRSWYVLPSNLNMPYGLLPETGWNYGLNFTQKFTMNYREAFITIDLYRTDFVNQVIVDADASPQLLLIYNLYGKSYSNTGQFEFGWEIRKRLFVRTAYRYVETMQTYLAGLREKPFVSRHRAFINFAYETRNEHWQFDFTTQFNGSKRLPDTESNPTEFQNSKRSPDFYNVLGQITYVLKIKEYDFNVYIGVENLLNYKQANPIIASDAPYSKYFDAAMVWGPIYGRMLYGGLRFKIK